MNTRKHVHRLEFASSPEQLIHLLITPSSIRQWWGAARAIVIPERGGIWAAAWGEDEDKPDYITVATIRSLEPPYRLVLADYRYFAPSEALPFTAEFVTEFAVLRIKGGGTLQVTQDGFSLPGNL